MPAAKPLPAPIPAMSPTLDSARTLLKQVFGYDEFRPLQAEIIAERSATPGHAGGHAHRRRQIALLSAARAALRRPDRGGLAPDRADAGPGRRSCARWAWPPPFSTARSTCRAMPTITRPVAPGAVKLLYVAPGDAAATGDAAPARPQPTSPVWPSTRPTASRRGATIFDLNIASCCACASAIPQAVCVALTATATPRVRDDIRQSWASADSDDFVASFDRPNLIPGRAAATDGLRQVLAFLENHRDQSGIIYCTTRKQVDT